MDWMVGLEVDEDCRVGGRVYQIHHFWWYSALDMMTITITLSAGSR